jgi:branched-chain amino acid transport system substrate-binding protein
MKKFFTIASLSVAVLASGCQKKDSAATQDDVIRIGEFGSMTGTEATFGLSTHNGIQLAIDEVNAAGGVNGKQLKLITADNGGKSEDTVTVVTRLIAQDKVHVLLGEVASSRSLAAAPIAQRSQVPMISPSSTNPKVTEVGNYIFRVCFTDPFQGKVIARFANTELNAKTAAILIDQKSDYSVGLADVFRKEFTAAGGQIVSEQAYVGGDIDFKGQLTNIRAKNPDVIMVPGYYTEVGLMAKQARDLGIKAPFLGGDGWDSPKLYEIGGKALEGSFFSNHYSVDDPDPAIQAFIERYKKAYKGEVPDGLAAMGYDAALVLVDALKRAASLSGDDIRKAISETKDFRGVTGVISIDDNRNAAKPAVMLKVAENGAFEFVKRVDP